MDLHEILQRIIENSGMGRDEIQNLIKEKKEELGDLITDEGAAFIVARELGVDILPSTSSKGEQLTTASLSQDMRDVNLTARVLKIYNPRTFEKDGTTNVVQNLLLGDKDGTIKLVLWGPDTQPVSDGTIKRGTICQLIGGYIRKGWDGRIEIHKGRRGRLQLDPKDIDTTGFPDPGNYIMKLIKFEPDENDIDLYARVGEIGSLKTF